MQRINSEAKLQESVFMKQLRYEAFEEDIMERGEDIKEEENIDLEYSSHMNEIQIANFGYIRSKSSDSKCADSIISKLLPHSGDVRNRSLVFQPPPTQITSNIIISSTKDYQRGGLHVFKKIKKTRIRGKCDYDKNICGYITKKVIRQFVGHHYENEARGFAQQFHCNFEHCKAYYLKLVQTVTGPSHLNKLFNVVPGETESIINIKLAFREFYTWFIRERYLRYLLLDGKMANKLAYIEYKNTQLFKYIQPSEQDVPQMRMRTRSFSGVKFEE